MKHLLPLLVLTGLLLPRGSQGAVVFGDDRELLNIGSHSSYRAWTVEDDLTGESRVVRQFTSRATGTFDLGPDVDLVFYTSGGFSQDRAAEVAELSGLGDTKLKGYLHAFRRRVVFSAGVNVPTGQTQLSEEQIRVGTAISPHVLGFRMKNYGGGLDVDLGVASGFELTPRITVGGGISTLLRGAYDLDQLSEYKPANEIALTAGADFKLAPTRHVTADLVYRIFGEDELGGAASFQEGAQIELNLVASLHGERWGLDAVLKDIIKADNELLLALPPGADNRVGNGNNLWLSVHPRYQGNAFWAVKGLVDYVSANQSQQQETSAWALGLGIGGEFRLTPVAILDVRVSRLTGGSEDDSLTLSGLDTVFSLRWQY